MKNIAIKRTNIDENIYNSSIFVNIFVKIGKFLKKHIKENLTSFFKCGVCQQSEECISILFFVNNNHR